MRLRVREGFLSRFFLSRLLGFGLRGGLRAGFRSGLRAGLRALTVAALLGLLAPVCAADANNPITLDTSETLFAVLTAINTCGYSVGLNVSDPQRAAIRAEVEKNLKNSPDAQAAMTAMCDWYVGHRGKDEAHDLSQYVSLALYIQGPPQFLPRVKEDDLPPDAWQIAGFSEVLEPFYDKAGLHAIWERHRANYAALVERYHVPLAKMVFDTDIYLKLQSGGYLGRTFTVYLDFMGDPNEANARNYGTDYDVVVFPSPDPNSTDPLKMPQIRHTYLHYLLDPMADKHFSAIKRIEPLLQSVKRAPLEEHFKSDISLLVTECMVRAIEIRTTGTKQTAEAMRLQAVDDAMKQGYILTRYFYTALLAFEKDPAGLRTEYSDILDNIDLKAQEKRRTRYSTCRFRRRNWCSCRASKTGGCCRRPTSGWRQAIQKARRNWRSRRWTRRLGIQDGRCSSWRKWR